MNRRKSFKKLGVLCLPLAIFVVMALHIRAQRVRVDQLLGTWKSDTPEGTFYLKFMSDGRYEELMELKDASMMGGASHVFKGRFSVFSGGIRLYDFKRYLGNFEGNSLFVPCSDSLTCVGGQEMYALDQKAAKKGNTLWITHANWGEKRIGISYNGYPAWTWTKL